MIVFPTKKLFPALALLTACVATSVMPSTASAVPKMDVKIAVGVGSTTLVARVPNIDLYDDMGTLLGTVGGRDPATFANWGMQMGARVTSGKLFVEMAIGFSRFYFEFGEDLALIAEAEGQDQAVIDALLGQTARMNQLEIPLTAGYVPYANPYFKIFLYGGWVSTFNIRGFVDLNGNRKALRFKPKDIPGYPLAIYLAGARFGAQVDLGPVNFDFNYTLGLNSFTKTDYRTSSHVTQFNIGWLF